MCIDFMPTLQLTDLICSSNASYICITFHHVRILQNAWRDNTVFDAWRIITSWAFCSGGYDKATLLLSILSKCSQVLPVVQSHGTQNIIFVLHMFHSSFTWNSFLHLKEQRFFVIVCLRNPGTICY